MCILFAGDIICKLCSSRHKVQSTYLEQVSLMICFKCMYLLVIYHCIYCSQYLWIIFCFKNNVVFE